MKNFFIENLIYNMNSLSGRVKVEYDEENTEGINLQKFGILNDFKKMKHYKKLKIFKNQSDIASEFVSLFSDENN